MNCCSKEIFNTRYRQACDDQVLPSIRYSAEPSDRTEYRFSPNTQHINPCLESSRLAVDLTFMKCHSEIQRCSQPKLVLSLTNKMVIRRFQNRRTWKGAELKPQFLQKVVPARGANISSASGLNRSMYLYCMLVCIRLFSIYVPTQYLQVWFGFEPF